MILVRPMTVEDIPLGLRLSRQAGWNQIEADWGRLLALQPDGGLVAEFDGTPVGTTTACVFGPVAWIAMVLVDESARGRGIGRALVAHSLEWLGQRGVSTVRLDATPLGQPLYEKLGFVAEYPLARYRGLPGPVGPPEGVRPMQAEEMADLISLDRAVTGTDRGRLLLRLAADAPEGVRVFGRGGRVEGFAMDRPGAGAAQVGPCIARPGAGGPLLVDALNRAAGRSVIVDIPDTHGEARAVAEAAGLPVQRTLMRMRRGPGLAEDLDGLWASSGPEMG